MNENSKIPLILNVVKFVLIAVGVLFTVMVLANNPDKDVVEKSEIEAFRDGGIMSFTMMFAIAIIIAAAASTVIFFILQMISDTKKTLNSILSILIALVLFVILSFIGSSDTWQSLQLKSEDVATPGTIGGVTAGIYTVLFGIIAAVLAIFVTPFVARFRK